MAAGLLVLLPELLVFQSGIAAEFFSITSSTKVFHWLHEGHLPSHLADS
jgi:hypothetical protein